MGECSANYKREVAILALLRLHDVTNHGVHAAALHIDAGECVCLSGPSGAGKSLLLRAIADLDPHQGEVWLDDREAASYAVTEWRRLVGLLPAEGHWWYEQVGAHFSHIDEAQWQMLGFTPEVARWQVTRCSTGERQRLALLRLLANRPRVLLLDEPTASLDPTGVRQVEALLQQYREQSQAAVLWVSHDPNQIARVANRHYRVEAGEVKEA